MRYYFSTLVVVSFNFSLEPGFPSTYNISLVKGSYNSANVTYLARVILGLSSLRSKFTNSTAFVSYKGASSPYPKLYSFRITYS